MLCHSRLLPFGYPALAEAFFTTESLGSNRTIGQFDCSLLAKTPDQEPAVHLKLLATLLATHRLLLWVSFSVLFPVAEVWHAPAADARGIDFKLHYHLSVSPLNAFHRRTRL